MNEFVLPVRIYYEDTDAGGLVYYANYLKFMERARTEWLRSLGFEQDALLADDVIFAVRSVKIDFLKPARFNDLLTVVTRVKAAKKASLTFLQAINVNNKHRELICEADIKVACLHAGQTKPRPIPQEIMKQIAYED